MVAAVAMVLVPVLVLRTCPTRLHRCVHARVQQRHAVHPQLQQRFASTLTANVTCKRRAATLREEAHGRPLARTERGQGSIANGDGRAAASITAIDEIFHGVHLELVLVNSASKPV